MGENYKICKDFMYSRCKRNNCKYTHDSEMCFSFWKFKNCKFGESCKKNHISIINPDNQIKNEVINELTNNKETNEKIKDDNNKKNKLKYNKKNNKIRNTESFDPITRPVDLRIVYDLGYKMCTQTLTPRDVLLVPNLFSDFDKNEIYNLLMEEINNCGIPLEELMKLWHGDTHYIADDHLRWKKNVPTFNMVIERIRSFFNMDVKATRFNLYKDTSQFKPFHFDASAINPDKAKIQNFTVGVSFGATRDAAFEHGSKKTIVSIPQSDGSIYAFAKDTNCLWRHGILQDMPVKDSGRISIICWGWVEY
jgi:hypothetical protein